MREILIIIIERFTESNIWLLAVLMQLFSFVYLTRILWGSCVKGYSLSHVLNPFYGASYTNCHFNSREMYSGYSLPGYIDLNKIDPKSIGNKLLNLLDGTIDPVTFKNCLIHAIRDTGFWYAIEYNGSFYIFDVRLLAVSLGLPEPELSEISRSKKEWMEKFFGQIETEQYRVDIEGSIRLLNQ